MNTSRLAGQAAEALMALLPADAVRAGTIFGGAVPDVESVVPGAAWVTEAESVPEAASVPEVASVAEAVSASGVASALDAASALGVASASGVVSASDAASASEAAAVAEAGASGDPRWVGQAPADQQLGFWLRRHPGLGPRERRWIADRVHEVLRQGRAFEAFLVHSREPVTCAALIGLADRVLSGQADDFLQWRQAQPPAVRHSLPDWLWQRLRSAHGDGAEALVASLLQPASIEIRANLLKGKARTVQEQLAGAGIDAHPVPEVPTALRLQGRPALARLPQFEAGWFELQDAGSQAIVEVCAARRGERVIDFCAGAGGKTLALAARMRNQGQLLAFDTDEARLGRLAPRLRRAGIDIVTAVRLSDSHDPRLARYRQWADLVLLDAPCSGSGTLRRHPDLKWRLQPADVVHYQQLQREIIEAALRLLRPGGRLVYATCSLLAEENEVQMQWLQPLAAQAGLQLADSRHWLPPHGGGDGFFMACWQAAPAAAA